MLATEVGQGRAPGAGQGQQLIIKASPIQNVNINVRQRSDIIKIYLG